MAQRAGKTHQRRCIKQFIQKASGGHIAYSLGMEFWKSILSTCYLCPRRNAF